MCVLGRCSIARVADDRPQACHRRPRSRTDGNAHGPTMYFLAFESLFPFDHPNHLYISLLCSTWKPRFMIISRASLRDSKIKICRSRIHFAIEMHNLFQDRVASIEMDHLEGLPWLHLCSARYCALGQYGSINSCRKRDDAYRLDR
jgi:hypothetical protein